MIKLSHYNNACKPARVCLVETVLRSRGAFGEKIPNIPTGSRHGLQPNLTSVISHRVRVQPKFMTGSAWKLL
eukprot:jgi/Botrbrau1/8520/Bobra.0029s0024.1